MENPNNNDKPWLAAAYVTGIGGMLTAYIVAGYFVAKWLAKLMDGPNYWLAIGTIAGLVLGIVNIVFVIKRFMGGQNG